MTELFAKLYANGALLILWGALLFHLVLPIPRSSHPITLWHKFAELLADKVNTQQNHQQSLISGSLALLLMLFPSLAVLFALKPLVWQPQLLELALLLLALDWRSNDSLAQALVRAMANEDKPAARSLLALPQSRNHCTLSTWHRQSRSRNAHYGLRQKCRCGVILVCAVWGHWGINVSTDGRARTSLVT